MQTHSAAATPVVFLPAWCMVSCGSVTAEVEGRVGSLYLLFSRMQTAERSYVVDGEESTETKCAKKVRFENFFGGNFACV